MERNWILGGMLAIILCVTALRNVPPGAERGPHGTIPYDVLIDASAPGAKIRANGQILGETPLQFKIFGDHVSLPLLSSATVLLWAIIRLLLWPALLLSSPPPSS